MFFYLFHNHFVRFVAYFDDVDALWQTTVFSRNIQPGYIKNAHVGVAMDGVVFYPWYYIIGCPDLSNRLLYL